MSKNPIFKRNLCWAGEIWRVEVVNLADVACVLRGGLKHVVNFFEGKKCTPEKI